MNTTTGKSREQYRLGYLKYKKKYLISKTQLQYGGSYGGSYGVFDKEAKKFTFNANITEITEEIVTSISSIFNVQLYILPKSLITIGEKAFYDLSKASFDFSEATELETIGDKAFWYCQENKTVKFHAKLNTIGDEAFYSCNNTTFDFSDATNLTTIGDAAFGFCKKLTFDFSKATQLTDIGELAFYSCTAITNITIPSTVTLKDNSFGNCSENMSVTIIVKNNDNELLSERLGELLNYTTKISFTSESEKENHHCIVYRKSSNKTSNEHATQLYKNIVIEQSASPPKELPLSHDVNISNIISIKTNADVQHLDKSVSENRFDCGNMNLSSFFQKLNEIWNPVNPPLR